MLVKGYLKFKDPQIEKSKIYVINIEPLFTAYTRGKHGVWEEDDILGTSGYLTGRRDGVIVPHDMGLDEYKDLIRSIRFKAPEKEQRRYISKLYNWWDNYEDNEYPVTHILQNNIGSSSSTTSAVTTILFEADDNDRGQTAAWGYFTPHSPYCHFRTSYTRNTHENEAGHKTACEVRFVSRHVGEVFPVYVKQSKSQFTVSWTVYMLTVTEIIEDTAINFDLSAYSFGADEYEAYLYVSNPNIPWVDFDLSPRYYRDINTRTVVEKTFDSMDISYDNDSIEMFDYSDYKELVLHRYVDSWLSPTCICFMGRDFDTNYYRNLTQPKWIQGFKDYFLVVEYGPTTATAGGSAGATRLTVGMTNGFNFRLKYKDTRNPDDVKSAYGSPANAGSWKHADDEDVTVFPCYNNVVGQNLLNGDRTYVDCNIVMRDYEHNRGIFVMIQYNRYLVYESHIGPPTYCYKNYGHNITVFPFTWEVDSAGYSKIVRDEGSMMSLTAQKTGLTQSVLQTWNWGLAEAQFMNIEGKGYLIIPFQDGYTEITATGSDVTSETAYATYWYKELDLYHFCVSEPYSSAVTAVEKSRIIDKHKIIQLYYSSHGTAGWTQYDYVFKVLYTEPSSGKIHSSWMPSWTNYGIDSSDDLYSFFCIPYNKQLVTGTAGEWEYGLCRVNPRDMYISPSGTWTGQTTLISHFNHRIDGDTTWQNTHDSYFASRNRLSLFHGIVKKNLYDYIDTPGVPGNVNLALLAQPFRNRRFVLGVDEGYYQRTLEAWEFYWGTNGSGSPDWVFDLFKIQNKKNNEAIKSEFVWDESGYDVPIEEDGIVSPYYDFIVTKGIKGYTDDYFLIGINTRAISTSERGNWTPTKAQYIDWWKMPRYDSGYEQNKYSYQCTEMQCNIKINNEFEYVHRTLDFVQDELIVGILEWSFVDRSGQGNSDESNNNDSELYLMDNFYSLIPLADFRIEVLRDEGSAVDLLKQIALLTGGIFFIHKGKCYFVNRNYGIGPKKKLDVSKIKDMKRKLLVKK